MQSSSFIRTVTGSTTLFKNNTPFEYVQSIKFYTETVSGSFTKKEYRWSFNNTYWSAWGTLNQGNLSSIVVGTNRYLYLEIRYVGAGTATAFTLNYTTTSGTSVQPVTIDASVYCLPDPACCNNEAAILYETTYITNATTLDGKPGNYYLLRSNHTGTQSISTITGLQAILNELALEQDASLNFDIENEDGSFGGAYSRTVGSTIFFKNIRAGSNKIVITDNNTGIIYIDASISAVDASVIDIYNILNSIEASIVNIDTSIYDIWTKIGYIDISLNNIVTTDSSILASKVIYDPSTLDPSLAMPAAVGGIPIGTTVYDLNGDNVTAILNDLLFPTVQPTLTAPSGTFTMVPSTTLYEVSANVSLTFNSVFNRGTIYNGATYQNVRSGLPNNYNFTGTGLVDVSSSSLTNSQSVDISVGLTQSWSVQISYDQGPQPLDNKGNNAIIGPLVAGTLTASSTRTITGAYPLYATTVAIGTLTKQTLVLMTTNPAPSTSGMLLVAEPDSLNKQKFEIPVPWTASLTGIENYNTVSAQWENELGSKALSLTRWTTSSVTETIQGYTISYTRYTYNGPDRAATTIRLQF